MSGESRIEQATSQSAIADIIARGMYHTNCDLPKDCDSLLCEVIRDTAEEVATFVRNKYDGIEE